MKGGLWLFAALLTGTVLANLLLADNGYVAIRFQGWLLETSVPTLALLIIGTYLVLRLLARLARLPRERAARDAEKRRERARQDLERGLLAMSAGRWQDSEQLLTRSAREAPLPVVHYLAAARAADLQGATQRREAWLSLARESDPTAAGPALVTQAEFLLKDKRIHDARDALLQLEALGNPAPRTLLLLARVFRQLGEYDRLRALEPRLREVRGLPPGAVDEIMDGLYVDMLRTATERGTLASVQAVWEDASRTARHRPEAVTAYARALVRFGDVAAAERHLRALLDEAWHEPAVQLYGELPLADALPALLAAEGWLRTRREDATLLVACARLALRADLVGKARSYLEASLGARPRVETYQLLAALYEQLGERERATQQLQLGLNAAVGRRADLPPVRGPRFPRR